MEIRAQILTYQQCACMTTMIIGTVDRCVASCHCFCYYFSCAYSNHSLTVVRLVAHVYMNNGPKGTMKIIVYTELVTVYYKVR